ncbi:hypothetical protein X975_09068, partial [Stegodyphus mimosarum]
MSFLGFIFCICSLFHRICGMSVLYPDIQGNDVLFLNISTPADVPVDATESSNLRSSSFVLMPLAAGGIGLVVGLFGILLIVGVIIKCSRNTDFVYEPAPTDSIEQHI